MPPRRGRQVHLQFTSPPVKPGPELKFKSGTDTSDSASSAWTVRPPFPEQHVEHLTFAQRQARKKRAPGRDRPPAEVDVFPMMSRTETDDPETGTGFSTQRPFPDEHIMRRRPRRKLPSVSEKRHKRYQKKRAKEDAAAARPVVAPAPQIIVVPSGGGGRPGPPGRPGVPGAPGAAGGGGGGAAGAAAAAAASGAAGAAGARKPEKKKKRRKASGITKAKKRYTDQRKIKMAEMRSLKSKRIREFAARTKKMPKKNRDEARKAYAAKANARYREMATKFPPARGLKDLQSVLQLIAKLDTVRMAQ